MKNFNCLVCNKFVTKEQQEEYCDQCLQNYQRYFEEEVSNYEPMRQKKKPKTKQDDWG